MAQSLASGIGSISLSSDVFHPVIAAIDFGTSSSGYAFAFQDKDSELIKSADVQLNKWQIGSASSSTDKAPTTILLKPDKTFDSFGYKAEDKYAKLADTKKHNGWWYFEKFKMALYEKQKLGRDTILYDAEGKSMPALDVFSIAIAHLKESVLQDIRSQNSGIQNDDVLYVLTVPAIWSDAAKQFMREAATATPVGIKDYQLKLVLEPEAASVYCRQKPSRTVRLAGGSVRLESLEIGHKYVILDLGGGTADIATHEVIADGKLNEINCARGDDLGGQLFNKNFLKFLQDLLGENIFLNWQTSKRGDLLRIQRAVEGCKWEVSDNDDDVIFDVPYSLIKRYNQNSSTSIEDVVSNSKFKRFVTVNDDSQLQLSNEFVRGFFDNILTGIEGHISTITIGTPCIETVFLVGGLAKSAYVRQCIKTKFPKYRLIVPEDPGVAVLKGAVLLGNRPQTIAGRIARYSYGIGVTESFVQGKHNEEYKFTIDGEVRCDNVFRKLIDKGHVMKYGDTFTTTTHIDAKLPETKQQTFTTYLYQSIQPSPMYCTEEGCTKLGGFREKPPEGGWPDYCKSTVQIVVGEAEFKFYAEDTLGREYETKVDFLLPDQIKT